MRRLAHASARKGQRPDPSTELAYGDILDRGALDRALEGVEAVVHLAAVIRERGTFTFERVNWQGTRNVVQAAKDAGVKKLIHISVLDASENSFSKYLRSRWNGEQEVLNGGVPYVIIRSSLLFGEGDQFFNVLAAVVKALPVVPVVGDGKAKLQPLAVEDLAECIVRAYENDAAFGKIIEVGGTEQISYEGIVDLVGQTLGRRRVIKVHVPISMIRPVAVLMDSLLPTPPVTPEELKMLKADNITDIKSVENNFGFSPRPVQGNIGYITDIGYMDALKINLGFMPKKILGRET